MADARVLIGREAIQEYLGVSKDRFYALIGGGLPAAKRRIGSREYWLGDKDLIDYWFKGLIVGVDMAPGVVFSRWMASFDGDTETVADRSLVFSPN